ncbi:MAG: glycosyltransferase family 39 protein [Planctomycetota bacterium]|nr:glycosyltransferase family 39 protein [Planctomycetota bacterium]
MDAVEAQQARSRRGDAWAFFALALCVLAVGSWDRGLFDADEGRYATVAWNMVAEDDWVTPRLNGMPFMDKPPLVYWVQAPLYAAFGRHEVIARAPTILAGAIWALFVFLFARAWTASRQSTWYAGLLAVTSAACTIGARVGPQMDMPLAAAVAGVLWAAWNGVQRPSVRASLGLGVAVGLGLLIKGPLVVAVPLLVAVAWCLAGIPVRAVLRVMFSPWAWLVALALASPWTVAVERANPGWIRHFIEYEHFGRFNEGDHRSFRPFWFYVPIALIYMAPWTALAWNGLGAYALKRGWLRGLVGLLTWSPWSLRPWGHALPARGAGPVPGRLAYGWFLAAFLLYSCAERKLLNYLLPAAAPLFVLLGAQLTLRLRAGLGGVWRLPFVTGCVLLLGGLFTLGGLWRPLRSGQLPGEGEAPRYEGLGWGLLVAGGLLLVGALVVALSRRERRQVAPVILAAVLGWWAIDFGMARSAGLGSARALAEAVQATRGDLPVVAFKRYPQGLGFYGAEPIWMAGGTPDRPAQREIVVPYARSFWHAGEGPIEADPRTPLLLTDAQWERLWSGGRRVLAIVRWAEIQPLGAYIVSGPHAGAGRTDLFLVSNYPGGN